MSEPIDYIEEIKKNQIVKVSNDFCRGEMENKSVYEMRIIALTASKINVDDEDFKQYELPAQEVLQSKEIWGGRDINELKKTIDRLANLKIKTDKKREYGWDAVFSTIKIKDNHIIVKFSPDIKKEFINLKKFFTTYHLENLLPLRSVYTQKIYKLVKSWENNKEFIMDINEMYEMLKVPKSYYHFYNFKYYVLDPSIKEIKAKTDLKDLYYEGIKKKRKTTHIKFILKGKSKEKIKEEENKQSKVKKMNKIYLSALNCLQDNTKLCEEKTKTQKKQTCEMCKKIFSEMEV